MEVKMFWAKRSLGATAMHLENNLFGDDQCGVSSVQEGLADWLTGPV